ncbi:hypothetical protein Q7P37_010541 [Cladosporium fusiforme]
MSSIIPADWPNLPKEKADAFKLTQWLLEHDEEWLLDACWLRYLEVSKSVYSDESDYTPAAWAQREKLAAQMNIPTVQSQLPVPNTILPPSPSSSGKGDDRLSALPHDLRFEILSYLLLPDFKFNEDASLLEDSDSFISPNDRDRREFRGDFKGHNLNRLALVSRNWRNQVEAFCSHALIVWKQLVAVRHKGGSWDTWVEWRRLRMFTTSARMEYVVRAYDYCAFCGNTAKGKSSRSWPGLVCCFDCEEGGECDDD